MNEQEQEQQDMAQDETATGDEPGEQSGAAVDFTAEQQERLDAIIADRLSRAKEKWEEQLEQAKQTERQKAEEEQLAEKEEFRTLYEKRQAELEDLKPRLDEAQTQLERYRDALGDHLQAQRENVPDHINALLDRLDPIEQLTWLTEYAADLNSRPPAPSLNAGEGSDGKPEPHRTPEQKKLLGDILGIDPKFIPDD